MFSLHRALRYGIVHGTKACEGLTGTWHAREKTHDALCFALSGTDGCHDAVDGGG